MHKENAQQTSPVAPTTPPSTAVTMESTVLWTRPNAVGAQGRGGLIPEVRECVRMAGNWREEHSPGGDVRVELYLREFGI